jgi:hypothetical protein
LIRPDVALECAWRFNALDFAMPFVVQMVKEYTERVDMLAAAHNERKVAEEAAPPSLPHMPVTQVRVSPATLLSLMMMVMMMWMYLMTLHCASGALSKLCCVSHNGAADADWPDADGSSWHASHGHAARRVCPRHAAWCHAAWWLRAQLPVDFQYSSRLFFLCSELLVLLVCLDLCKFFSLFLFLLGLVWSRGLHVASVCPLCALKNQCRWRAILLWRGTHQQVSETLWRLSKDYAALA